MYGADFAAAATDAHRRARLAPADAGPDETPDADLAARYGTLDILEAKSVEFDGRAREHGFDRRERVADDDALDAVVAAFAAWKRACRDADSARDRTVPDSGDPESEVAAAGTSVADRRRSGAHSFTVSAVNRIP